MLAPVEMQQRLVPPDMIAKVVAVIPGRHIALDQVDPGVGSVRHVVDMGDRVQPPGVVRGQHQPRQSGGFGCGIISGLLQREGMAPHREASQRVVGVVPRQNPLDGAPHAAGVTHDEAHPVTDLGGQGVGRVPGQHVFQMEHGGTRRSVQPSVECCKPRRRTCRPTVDRKRPPGSYGRHARRSDHFAPAQHHAEQAARHERHGRVRLTVQHGLEAGGGRGTMGEERAHHGVPVGKRRRGVQARLGAADVNAHGGPFPHRGTART
jgi:hypothetical protein